MTEVLPTWITTAEAAVGKASDVAGTRKRVETLGKLQEALDRLLAELPGLAEAAELGKGYWWTGVTVPTSIDVDLRKLQHTANDPSERTVQRFERDLKEFLDRQIRVGIVALWSAHVKEVIGEMPEFARAIKMLGGADTGLKAQVAQLDNVVRPLETALRRPPKKADVQALKHATVLFEQIEKQLPARVRTFVIAATRPGGASVDLLDGVRDWLTEHNLLGSVRVRFGTSGDQKS
ncbi:hypothetical protein [Micromonospora cathayae]|uniref:Uncharacterized protein n=1 Tax=Micromonospora cathayae TaxID=3028804 RepID=A0ABY7ZNV6_9ACTN|nr:hypothetical protein [Micromonospora sp. HUAS 3]WDZ84710.1 hypothetical protein PVK37_30515 [Micromonospora sp. HUAS 3]